MKTIRKPGEYAPYIFLPLNQKEITLRDSIKLLFQGSVEAGHYDLIVDNSDLQI